MVFLPRAHSPAGAPDGGGVVSVALASDSSRLVSATETYTEAGDRAYT
ncbi:hypothetical protein GFS60_06421 (plasmid) [Rhodococcus sp. WAY2]|nr:hypothetical protein GFS60_06421 [Rhodococcus sp. WAY2]